MAEGNGQAPQDDRVSVTVDGREVRVPKGTLVLDAATEAGVHIPVYCAHTKMDPVAVCRMCLVHVEKMPKLQPACATTVSDGMVVTTQSEAVTKTREGVLEFLLLNHPLDCPVCDRGGECDLQDFAFRYGPETSRFPITEKVHGKKAVKLSEKIEFDQERCILCWRCTRYYDEITGEKELVLQQRGVHTVIETFNNQELQSEFQGNLPEVCPVGALTHRQYRFTARPWDLQRTKSVCNQCAYGCNVNVDSRDFDILRFASRDNPQVEDMWLCDRGRYSATGHNDRPRVRRPAVKRGDSRVDTTPVDAVRAAAEALLHAKSGFGAEAIGVIAGAECTNEEYWQLQRLARDVLGTPHIDHQLRAMGDIDPWDCELGIAEIEDCAAVLVLGEAPEREAPVLQLRLHKAATKRGVKVIRVAPDGSDTGALEGVAAGRVGVIAHEDDRESARVWMERLQKQNRQVAMMSITRGANGRGAKEMGVTPGLLPGYKKASSPGKNGAEILAAAAAGEIRLLLFFGAAGLVAGNEEEFGRALRATESVIAVESIPSLITENATVILPGHSFYEKMGTVTNLESRVQRIRPAVPPATTTPAETILLGQLAAEMGEPGWETDALRIHRQIADAIPAYAQAGNGGRAIFSAQRAEA